MRKPKAQPGDTKSPSGETKAPPAAAASPPDETPPSPEGGSPPIVLGPEAQAVLAAPRARRRDKKPNSRYDKPAHTKRRNAPNGSKTNAQAARNRLKAAQAVQLRMEGKTFEHIRKELKYNTIQSAWDAVDRSLKAIVREPAAQLIELELARLDVMWEMQYLNAQAGDVNALASCLRIMERRSRLLGMDAPTRLEATGKDGVPLAGGGVFVIPGVMTPEDWAKAAAAQQERLTTTTDKEA